MKKNKMIAASALALTLTLAGGAVLTGHAFAAASQAAAATDTSGQSAGKEMVKGRGGDHGVRVKLDEAEIAKLLGVTEDELNTERKAGKSLAAIAEAKGIDVQSVIDLAAKQLTANLNEKLESGKVTQEQYDADIAGVADKAADYVNNTFAGKGGKGGFGGRSGAKIDETAITELLGMTSGEYDTAAGAGKSIAAMAEEGRIAAVGHGSCNRSAARAAGPAAGRRQVDAGAV
ncbi:hypothetical protein D3P08_21335 [Paenibacillus nanensis]|uniref:LysM domain-containing protein n=1 Tax=Paenibacillus nanensis TaxID=393251 RepID=A0A3A1UNH0_9BACL|nr:hypothetical protein [Paenibacillus nanensis]RIX50098.1 hypothetical protein D3P08_21335 [Paenibacillus nanensis]